MKRVLYFSHVNWSWIKQRPHFIPYYIAKSGIEVTYFSLSSIASFMRRSRLKVKNTVNENNLHIKETKVFPLGSRIKILGRINYLLIQSKLKDDYDSIILAHPTQLDYISPKQKEKQIIYECMDNHPFFTENEKVRQLLIEKEKVLCSIANRIIVSSLELKRRLQDRYSLDDKKIKVVFNALDEETIINFNTKLIKLNKPNLVYVGTIGSWFDFKVISDFAKHNREYTIYLVGPKEKTVENQLKEMPDNVILVGAIEHHEIIRYIRSGEIMVLPFKINDVVECVDPVKIYEYMALNKPIVSSYWGELEKFRDKVVFYNDAVRFEAVVKNIDVRSPDLKINSEFINKECWKERVLQYLNLF